MTTIYKLTIEDTYCIFHILADALVTIKEYKYDNYDKTQPLKIELEICEISEEELAKLPEFEGF